jgi:hypothetical protein
MHAFTRPSMQLRRQVRAATLRSLHHTSLYRRLIFQSKASGARHAQTGLSIHTRLRTNPQEGVTLFKFLYGQLYNGKLANRYGHAPTDACPYVTAQTHTPTLQANASTTNTLRSSDTTQHANSFTPQLGIPPKAEAHSTVRRNSA